MILAVLLNMILIPTFKIEDAAWATAFALSGANAFRIVFVWVKFKLQPFTGKILLIAICSAAAFAVQYWILLDINEFVLAAIKGTIFAVPLLASFVYFKIIPAQMLRGKFN